MSNYRPDDLRFSDFEFEKHTEEGGTPQRPRYQNTNYAQHNPIPPAENNPNHNPSKDPNSFIHAQIVNREKLLKNIKNLTKLEKVRLSRSSYLLHANRYNIRNQ